MADVKTSVKRDVKRCETEGSQSECEEENFASDAVA
jgi:hypothetical protein